MSVERLGSGEGGVPAGAAVLRLRLPLSEYPPLALWAHSNLSHSSAVTQAAAESGARRHYLMVPLNSIVDEHYSPYLCVARVGDTPLPKYCE